MTLVSCRLVITPQARSAPPGRGDLSDARPAHSAGAAAPGGAEATAAEHRPLTTSSQKLSYLFESPCERGRAAACVRPCQFTCRRRCQFTWVPSMRVYISIAVVVEKKSSCFYRRMPWRSVRASLGQTSAVTLGTCTLLGSTIHSTHSHAVPACGRASPRRTSGAVRRRVAADADTARA